MHVIFIGKNLNFIRHCIKIKENKRYCIVTIVLYVTIDGVWIGELDLLTTYTHHSELQVITTLLLISTLYKPLHAKTFPSLVCLQQPFPSNGF
jgi:hypothetical protein